MWSMTCTLSVMDIIGGIRSAAGDKAEILYARGSNIYHDAELEKGGAGIRPLERGNELQLLDEAFAYGCPCRCDCCGFGRMC